MTLRLIAFIFVVVPLLAQEVPHLTVTHRRLQIHQPSNDLPNVFFWVERTTNLTSTNWQTMATITVYLPEFYLPTNESSAVAYRVRAEPLVKEPTSTPPAEKP